MLFQGVFSDLHIRFLLADRIGDTSEKKYDQEKD